MPELHINGQLVTAIELGGQQVLKIEDSLGNVLYETGPEYFCLTSNQDGSYVGGNGRSGVSLECSTDKVNWTPWDWEVYTYLNAGDKLYLRGDNPNGLTIGLTTNIWSFTMSGSFAASGDLTTLIDKDGGVTTLPDYCFRGLFSEETALTTAPQIKSVTRVNQWALAGIFEGCNNLTSAMDMRNVTYVGSYGCTSMYYGCTALTAIYAPSITAWNTTNFQGWVTNIGGTGTMWKPAYMSIPNGNNGKPSGWSTQDYPGSRIATPTMVYTDDTYGDGCDNTNGAGTITLECATAGATIYYRVAAYECDGETEVEPDLSSQEWDVYNGGLNESFSPGCDGSLPLTSRIQAYATKSGYTDSAVMDETYSVADDMSPCVDCSDCANWAECGYGCEEECIDGTPCQEVDCSDCNNWSECGYESYEDCDCQQYGECGDPCSDIDCSDCSNWDNECCGYESYEDCDCQVNGNCGDEPEEPEE